MKTINSISDRYLSSKINHNKGDFRGIVWENWEVVINFIDGIYPNYTTKTYKNECASQKEAIKLESRALKIIELAVKDPNNEFFKQRIIKID